MPKIEASTSTFINKTSKHVERLQDDQSLVHPEKIPLFVWQNKSFSKDHAACISQNGGDFGYIPLQDLTIYNGPQISWGRVPDILEAHTIIRNSGAPNFLEARIPVATQLNPDKWYFHLRDYWDRQLPDLIKYGFPLDFDRSKPLQPTYDNHASATQYIDCVEQYINEELQYGAIYGPFKDLPFPVHVSPLMTRPKQNSDKRRTIMDLSWPKGASVNNAIHKFRYLNTYFSSFISSFLHFPTFPTPIVYLAVWVPSFHFNHTFSLISYSLIQILYKFLIDIATYHTVVYSEFHKVKFIQFSCWTHFHLL